MSNGCVVLTSVLVTLDGGTVTLDFDDLADEFVPADLDQLIHLHTGHALADNNFMGQELVVLTWACDLVDLAIAGLLRFQAVHSESSVD